MNRRRRNIPVISLTLKRRTIIVDQIGLRIPTTTLPFQMIPLSRIRQRYVHLKNALLQTSFCNFRTTGIPHRIYAFLRYQLCFVGCVKRFIVVVNTESNLRIKLYPTIQWRTIPISININPILTVTTVRAQITIRQKSPNKVSGLRD